MLTEVILEQVSESVEQSEIEVLIAIGESYCKYFSMLCSSSDINIVQEAFVFMEDGEKSGENVLTKIKNVFIKVGQYIKTAFQKIFSFIQKKFVKYKANLYGTINLLGLADAIVKANPNEVVREYEVIEEAMTPEEKERREALKRFEEKKAAVKQNIQDEKKQEKEMFKGLKKNYASDVNRKVLTNDDLDKLVASLRQQLSPSDFAKLQNELKNIDTKPMTESALKNLGMIDSLHENMVKANQAELEFMRKIQAEIDWKGDVRSERDIEMRLELVEKFSNTLGSVLNDMTKSDAFSAENVQRYLHESMSAKDFQYIGSVLKQITGEKITKTVTALANSVKSSSLIDQHLRTSLNPNEITAETQDKIAKNLEGVSDIGSRLYQAHKEFDNAVFEDEMKRKELGMKANKSIKGILFALNQIKEESYGYTDDSLFNKIAYDSDNAVARGIAGYLGGPFTILKKTIAAAVVGPGSLAIGMGDLISYIGFRASAHSLNKSHNKIVSDREAYTGKHFKNAIKDLPYEEKMEAIHKAKDEMQREVDEKTREKMLAKAKKR